jgi:hypothetical protein
MKNITRAGVDVAKSVFHIHAKDRHGQKTWHLEARSQWKPVAAPITGHESCSVWDKNGQKNGTIGFSEGTGDTSTISRYSATNEYYLPAKSRGG